MSILDQEVSAPTYDTYTGQKKQDRVTIRTVLLNPAHYPQAWLVNALSQVVVRLAERLDELDARTETPNREPSGAPPSYL